MELGFSPDKTLYGQLEFVIDTLIQSISVLEAKVYNYTTLMTVMQF